MTFQARALGIALLAAAAIAAAAVWQVTRTGGGAEQAALAPEAPPAEDPGPRGEAPESGRQSVASAPPAADGAPDPLGAGRVRGRIDVARGAALSGQYELQVDSPGSPTKVYVFPGDERLVTLDLPPGRSVLFARAEGLASRPLAIERTDDAPPAPFQLLLEPAGRLGGTVLDARGAPLADLPVHLLASGSRDSRAVRSDAAGRYEFADVPLGAYQVAFGSAASPVAPVVPAEVVAGEVRDVAPQAMPDFGEAEILVQDGAGNPRAGARVTGRGQRGGTFDGTTDDRGVFRARFLPVGALYVDVAGPDGGRASEVLEVEAGRIARATVRGG